jgi:hypothetical protein
VKCRLGSLKVSFEARKGRLNYFAVFSYSYVGYVNELFIHWLPCGKRSRELQGET